MSIGKAAFGIRVTVCVRNVRFDVIDGSSIHQICTCHMKDGTLRSVPFDGFQTDAGQSDRIGAEGRAGGKDPFPYVAAQPGRAYGRRPGFSYGFRKLPDQPEMRKFLQPPQGICNSVFRFKNNDRVKGRYESALPGNAEFCRKITANMGNRAHHMLLYMVRGFLIIYHMHISLSGFSFLYIIPKAE